MSQPVEPKEALGGTESSDGYFNDFTDRLGSFVKNYPLLASSYGCSDPDNLRARVITFGSRGYGACSDGSSSDDSEHERNEHERNEHERNEHERSERSEEKHRLPLITFGGFIVDVDGGAEKYDGAMDETGAEGGSYEQFNTEIKNQPNSILNFAANK